VSASREKAKPGFCLRAYLFLRRRPGCLVRLEEWKAAERAKKQAPPAGAVLPPQERVSVSAGWRKVEVSVQGCDEKPKEEEKDGAGKPDPLGAGILKVLGAAAAGIGAVSAIVAVGAAVLWIRFDQAGIPATQAVSVQPKYEALVQGGEQTIVFLLIALVAVLLIFFADPGGVIRWVTIWAFLLLFAAAAAATLTTNLGPGAKVGLVLLAALLLVGSVVVGVRTGQRFWPLALAIFVSSLVFSSASALLIAKQQDFVQAVAVLRDENDRGLRGVYVAAGEKTIYIAQETAIPTDAGGGRAMLDIPREGAVYAVGPLESQEKAEQRARFMLSQLKKNRGKNPPPPKDESGGEGKGQAKPD